MKNAAQWEDLIFEAASKVEDSAGRKLFLDQACIGDPILRAAVEQMLADQAEADRFFTNGTQALKVSVESFHSRNGEARLEGDSRVKLPEDEQVGSRIGRYKIVEKIGEGGCGRVYSAEQEEPVHRRVALKIIKLGMDTKSLVSRFEAERQVLALMDHPNIARALDAGATETGRPYFVMELVLGDKITHYCDEQKLDVTQRLELFIQICNAVQHAHQKGVIHRDIKPSNILVTTCDNAPVPKVIDFGIAKAITGERLADNTVFTACEQFLGTPAYMSPEQAQMGGVDIDTRSDIYSLGVLLYELLTGQTPFDAKKLLESSMEEMQRILREVEPPRPSVLLQSLSPEIRRTIAVARDTEPDRLSALMRGDLDWIAMKAMEKDRERRYETAHEMALDVARYMKGEPVLASPPGRLYVLGKLVRRNRGAFAAAGAVAATLCLGLGVSSILYFQERAARQEAELEKATEARLRLREEAANQIGQAATYLEYGKYEETANILRTVQLDDVSAMWEAAKVYRTVGIWYATNGDWANAATFFKGLSKVNRYRNYNSPSAVWDVLEIGVSIAKSGRDHRAFENFRQLASEQFTNTTDPFVAERLVRATLLLPALSPETLQELDGPAHVIKKSISENSRENLTSGNEGPWRQVALALLSYRERRYGDSVAECQQFLSNSDTNSARVACAQLILAMSWQHLGNVSEALNVAGNAQQAINAEIGAPNEKKGSPGSPWFDWAMAQILLQEWEGMASRTPTATRG